MNFLLIKQTARFGIAQAMKQYLTLLIIGGALLAGCSREPPPRTVTEFVDNPNLLEAAMVRCSQDRSASRYVAECINARDAVARIEAKEEAARKVEFEQRSASKRKALRRTQAAAAQARNRAAEARRRQEEAEYHAQFGVPLPGDDANAPQAVTPEGDQPSGVSGGYVDTSLATDGGNAPGAIPEPETDEEVGSDLDSIRDELRRRNEEEDEVNGN